MNDSKAIIMGAITGTSIAVIIILLINIFYKQNNIQTIGHPKATAHVLCYSGPQKIYEAFVTDYRWVNTRIKFTREDTQKEITVNGNCIVEE